MGKKMQKNKFISWLQWYWEPVALVVIIIAAIVFLFCAGADYNSRVDACESRGGVYLDPYCLNLEEL